VQALSRMPAQVNPNKLFFMDALSQFRLLDAAHTWRGAP
jgi:hypothetical protein